MDNWVKTTTPLSSFSSVQSNLSMAISSPSSAPFLDSLFFCEEQDHPWSYDHNEEHEHEQDLLLPTINHQDFFWEDEELVHLFTKEQLQTLDSTFTFDHFARKDAVDWILKVKSHFGFTHLTAILAINYLDRFLSSLHFQQDKPWMIQLLVVTSLSLAAKVEETQVPSLLDLQEKVKECNEMIMEVSHISCFNLKKRKFEEDETMHHPITIIVNLLSRKRGSYNNSWVMVR